jgi:hypothetical protein
VGNDKPPTPGSASSPKYATAPHVLDLPTWKAVFFNPKTDAAVIDRLVYSIEEMI